MIASLPSTEHSGATPAPGTSFHRASKSQVVSESLGLSLCLFNDAQQPRLRLCTLRTTIRSDVQASQLCF